MLIEKVMELSNQIEKQLDERYKEYDLTHNQANLILYLYRAESNEIQATQLLNELQVDKRLLSIALKSLEQKDYIIRHVSTTDKRQKNIELSDSALTICEDLIGIKEEVNSLIEFELTADQIEQFNSL